jgi:hypothetical protein
MKIKANGVLKRSPARVSKLIWVSGYMMGLCKRNSQAWVCVGSACVEYG